jgi:hypothetical protein
MTESELIAIAERVQRMTPLTTEQRADAEWLAHVYGAIGVPEARRGVKPEKLAACQLAHPEAHQPVGSLEWHRGRWDAIAFGWPGRAGIGLDAALLFAFGEAEALRLSDIEAMAVAGVAAHWFAARQALLSKTRSSTIN